MTPFNTDFADELNELNLEVCDILLDILRGLSFIHSLGEVHRDLKPENVLFSYIHQRWKISDFGTTAEGTSKRLQHTTLQRGTSSYRAPEIVKDGSYNNKADIWAFGCIAYELCTKTPAFSGDWEILFSKDASTKTIFNFPRFGLRGHAVSVAQDINLRCVAKPLCQDFDARPSATCLLMNLNTIRERKANLE